jgi:hypothetical protein
VKLSQAQEQYQNQWIAFRIEKEGADPIGTVVLHEENRTLFEKRMHNERVRGVYITFAGDVLPAGYVAMF